MNSLFAPSLRAPLGATVDSSPISTGPAGQSVLVVITSGTAVLVKNGLVSGQSVLVAGTDQLVIRVIAGTTYATPQHVVLTIGGVHYSYTVVTVDDPRLHVYPPQVGILPPFLAKNHDGTDFFDNGARNKLALMSRLGALVARRPAEYDGQPTVGQGASGVVYSPASRADFVLRLDRQTMEVLGTVEVGLRPFQSSEFGPSGPSQLHLVSVSEADSVVVLNNTGTVVARIPVSASPFGIACSPTTAYVACFTGQAIAVLTKSGSGSGWSVVEIQVPGYSPFNIVWDGLQAWATCPRENTILRIAPDLTVTAYALSGSPTGIAYDGQKIWITRGTEKSVVTWSEMGVQATYAVETLPWSIVCGPNGRTYVGCFGRSAVYSIDGLGVVTEISAGQAPPYQLRWTAGSNTLAVFEYYPATPNYLYTLDQSLANLRLTDAHRVRALQEINTNVTWVDGLSAGISLPLSVPDLYSAVIVKNSVGVGQSTTVQNGDQIYLNFTVPAVTDRDIQIPMFVGNNYDYFLSVVPKADPLVFPVTFAHVPAALPNTVYTSNTVTISDIDAGTSITLTLSTGLLIKNGVPMPSVYSTPVTNGDTVALRLTSSSDPGASVTCRTDLGIYSTYWTIVTSDISRQWLAGAYRTSEVYDIPVPQQIGQAYRDGNSIQKIKKSDYTVGPEFSLHNPTVVPNASLVEFGYAVSYYENLIYKVSPNGSVAAISTLDATAVPRPDGLYAPSYHGKNLLTSTRYVSVSSLHIREVDVPDADVPLYVGTGWLGATVKSADGQTVYAAQSDGTIAVYRYAPQIKLFTKFSAIDCRPAGPAPGGLRELVLDGLGTLWALDIANNVLIRIIGGTMVSVTGLGSASIWAVVAGPTAVWLADAGNNTVMKIGLDATPLARIRVGSVPSALVLDSQTGNVWVSYYAGSTIDVIDQSTNRIVRSIPVSAPVAGMREDSSGYIWVLHMYSDMYGRAASTVNDSDIVIPVFTPVVGAAPTVRIKSNTVTVSGLPQPARLTVTDVNNTRLYIGADAVGATSATVNNGDTLTLGTDASPDFASTSEVLFTGFNTPVQWSVTTAPDIIPNYVYFDPIYDLRLRYAGESSSVVISGVSPGSSITLSVLNDTGVKIKVDGIEYTGAAPASVGSVVSIVYDTTGWYYGQSKTLKLQHGIPGSAVTFGTFDVSTLVLLGASCNPVYDVTTFDYFDGYTKNLRRAHALADAPHSGIKLPSTMNLAEAAHSGIKLPSTLALADAPHSGIKLPSTMNLAEAAQALRPLFAKRLLDGLGVELRTRINAQNSYLMPTPEMPRVERKFAGLATAVRVGSLSSHAVDMALPSMPEMRSSYLVSSKYVPAEAMIRPSHTIRSHGPADYTARPRTFHDVMSPTAAYERNAGYASIEVEASYQPGARYSGSEIVAEYQPGVHHLGSEIAAEYQPGVHHLGSEIVAEYKPGVHHKVYAVEASYQPGVRHLGSEIHQSYRPRTVRASRTAFTAWARSASNTGHDVAAPTFVGARSKVMPQVARPTWTKVTRSVVESARVQAFRHHALTEMLAGTLSDQGVFTTQQSAIDAAIALGYPAGYITAWWFHTLIEVAGANEVAVAWMWKIPPEVTSRPCGSLVGGGGSTGGGGGGGSTGGGSAGGGPKYPIPHKWYVQGG